MMSKTKIPHSLARTFYRFISVITLAVTMMSATQLLYGIGVAFAAANLIAIKTDSLKTDADASGTITAGDTLKYTVVVQNTGDTAAANAAFSDTIDPNTTLVAGSVRTTPIARNDSGYSTVGNVQMTVTAPGVLANDNDPDETPGLAAVAAAATSANGGNVNLAADGSFTYNPPAGFSGTDTFTYTVQDADSNTDTATVSITVGQVVWFINNAVGGPGDGRFTSPFNSIVNFNSLAADEAGDYIFVYQGAGAYTGTLTLLNNQQLIGHGVGLTVAPNLSIAPASRPAVANIALGSGNTVRGLNVNTSSGTGISGTTVGSLTVNNVSVTNSGGAGVNLGSGALAVTFDSINATGGANGVSLSNVTGSFVLNGGVIQNSTGHGITVSNTTGSMSALTLGNVTVRNAGANGINLEVPPGGSAMFANVTVSNSTIQNNASTGLRANIQGTGVIGKIDIGSNSFTGNNVGIDLATNETASIDFDIHNNPALTGTATQVNIAANDTVHNNGSGPTMEGYIRNNPLITASPTGNVYIAVWVVSDGDGNITVDISGNTVTDFGDSGIDVESRGGTGDVNARISNNAASTTAAFPLAGMFLRSGNGTPGETSLLCVNASGNSMNGGAGAVADYYLDRFNPATTLFQIQGLTPASATPAQAETYIVSTDSAPPATAFAETGTYTAAACASVSFAALPGTNQRVRDEGPRPALTAIPANVLADLGSRAGQVIRSLLSEFSVHTAYASGETVNLTLGALEPGQQVTITFDVTVNDPLSPVGTVLVSNQGLVTADGGISVLTDDPDAGGASDPTVTVIDRPDTTVTSLDRASGSPTRNASVTWQVAFADPVDGLTASNFSLVEGGVTGASITSVTETSGPPSTTWHITANTGSGDGTLGLNLVNDTGLSHDVTNLSFTGQVFDIDRTPPTVTNVTASTSGCLGAGSEYCNATDVVTVQVTFNEIVNVNTSGGIPTLTLETGSASYTGGSGTNTLTFEYAVQAGDTAADLDYAAASSLALNGGTIQDAAANDATLTLPAPGGPGSLGANEDIVVDTTDPTVSYFHRRSPLTTPTNSDTLQFEIDFSEPIGGPGLIGANDFDVTGPTAAIVSIGVVDFGNGTYYADVSGGDLTGYTGTVGLDFSAGMLITDRAGNPVANSEPADDETYDVDNIVPTVSLSSVVGDPTNVSPIPVTVTFSESVTGFTAGDILAGNGTVSNFTGSGADYTFDLTPSTDGLVTADIPADAAQDAAGNGNSLATQFSRTFDSTAPDTTITSTNGLGTITNGNSATFDFTGNDGTGVGGLTYECRIDGGGYSTCTSPQGYTGLSDGPHTFEVRATDSLGNTDPSPDSHTWTVDTVNPYVVSVTSVTSPTNQSTVTVTIIFNEPVTGYSPSTGTGGLQITGPATDGNPTGSSDTYTFDLTFTGQGSVTVLVPDGTAQDAAANFNQGGSNSLTIVHDSVAPTVTVEQASGQADPTAIGPVNFTAVFSEAINPASFTGTDVTLSGGANPATAVITEIAPYDGTTFNMAVSGMSASGTVIADIPAGGATDLAGNGNAPSVSGDNTVTLAGSPIVTTDAATGVGANDATLNGTVNANHASTVVTFEYGLTTAYGSTVTADQSPVAGNADTPVSAAITGLLPNTTYHYRVIGQNMAGTTDGGDMTFTTGKVAPTATTGPATDISAYTATLNGTVNAFNDDTTVTFEYGLDTSYGSTVTADQSPVTGLTDTPVSAAVTGLTANVTYHFRVVAANSVGTIYGADMTFTTIMGEQTATFKSIADRDGWTLESAEKSGKGAASYNGKKLLKSNPSLRLPPLNSTADIYVGDGLLNNQFRSVLSFNTASLPDNAVILSVTIKLKRQGLVGTNPFLTHKNLVVDMRKPFLGGSVGLVPADFQAAASLSNAGMFAKTPNAGWYKASLKPSAFPFINLGGTTQFRLRFQLDDNNDEGYDYLRFYSGNADPAYRPMLIVEYYLP
jgi:hypothetical protein